MAQFRMKIAGQTALVTSLFESTRDYCSKYLTEDGEDFSITVTRQDMDFEQDFLYREAREEGIRPRRFTDPFLERAVIQRRFAEHLFDRDTLLFHGSAVAVDGQGYLFTAKCGTGKSTHTRLWRQVFGDRAVMINDDKPFLQIREEGVLLWGAPWSGKHGLDNNVSAPLKGICFLRRGAENRIARTSSEEAREMLKKQAVCPLEMQKLPAFYRLVDTLAETCALWEMECNKEQQAAICAHGAMSE